MVTTSPGFTGRLAAVTRSPLSRTWPAFDQRRSRRARAHHARVPQPFVDALAFVWLSGKRMNARALYFRIRTSPCSSSCSSARRAWRRASSDRPRAAPLLRIAPFARLAASIAILEVAPALRAAAPPRRSRSGRSPPRRSRCGGRPSRSGSLGAFGTIASVTRTLVRLRLRSAPPDAAASAGAGAVRRALRRPLRRRPAARPAEDAAGLGAVRAARPADAVDARRSSGGRPGRHTSIISGSAGFSSRFRLGPARRRLGSPPAPAGAQPRRGAARPRQLCRPSRRPGLARPRPARLRQLPSAAACGRFTARRLLRARPRSLRRHGLAGGGSAGFGRFSIR